MEAKIYSYICLYKGKRYELKTNKSKYEAQKIAAAYFKAKKSYEVSVHLAEVDGKEYLNSTCF